MPYFEYRAVDKDSHLSTGIMVAENESSLERRVAGLGLWLIEVQPHTPRKHRLKASSVSRRDLVDFFNGLATLVDAGIDIAEGLRVIVAETESEQLRQVLEDVRLNVESGGTIFESMSAHPEVFSAEVINLIKAGEYSGELVTACFDISEHLEWLDGLMGDVKQATIYPAMVALAVGGLVFIMFAFVVPQFAAIFDALDLELPLLTKLVIGVGEFFSVYWWLVLSVVVGLFATLKFLPAYWPGFAYMLDAWRLRIPVFGELLQLLILSRFSHNLSLSLKAGVPIIEALELVAGVVSNRVMQKALSHATYVVSEGRKLSEALMDHDIMSPIVMRMIVVGEETGNLDSCLAKVAKRYDMEIPRKIKRVFGILEPVIILTLIGIVGIVAGAIFMPLFSLMSGIGG